MMDQRQGDPRIYIVTLIFLSCIISGGVLLGLYLILSDPNPLFLQAGMVFVGLPWLFWFLAYLYSCVLKPCTVSVTNSVNNNSFSHFDPEKGEKSSVIEKSISINNKKIPEKENTTTSMTDLSAREGEKHVQFGDVVVLGNEEDEEEDRKKMIQEHMRVLELDEDDDENKGGSNSSSDDDDHDEDCDRTPLRLSVGNK